MSFFIRYMYVSVVSGLWLGLAGLGLWLGEVLSVRITVKVGVPILKRLI